MSMPVSTWVEVDLDRFAQNLRLIREKIGDRCGILLVVKADAYGHGAVEISEAAEREGVSVLGVATLHEGIQLRQAGCRLPVIVLSPLLESEIAEAVAHGLDPTVADLKFASALSHAATATGKPVRCHVEIDTGMGRVGVLEGEAEVFLAALDRLPGLRLASIYTHFPDADAEDPSFARAQSERFHTLAERLAARGLKPPRLHAANSAGALNLPEARYDWVRLGLLAYGHQPPHTPTLAGLAPVMALKSRIVQVRDLPAGHPISYGRTYRSPRDSRIGVVPVGYGHGYSWLLSNRGFMQVAGVRAPIVGRVTMDLTMLDLTDIPAAQVGDEVVLFDGANAAGAPTLEEVASWSETLPYEIMCTIGKRVTRIYVREGRPVKLTSLVGEHAEWADQAADHFRRRAEAVAAARSGR
jgi:alanine racemase